MDAMCMCNFFFWLGESTISRAGVSLPHTGLHLYADGFISGQTTVPGRRKALHGLF